VRRRRRRTGTGGRTGIAGDRGSSTPELVVILPVLLLLIGAGLQLALWSLASHALADSVDKAGAVLRAGGGTSSEARAAVREELRVLAPDLVLYPTVSVLPIAGGVGSISASAEVPSLLAGTHLGVSATSAGPYQRFRATG
jgi:Flp pilus assembly protein TadG